MHNCIVQSIYTIIIMKLWHKRVGEPYSGNLRCFLGQNGHFKGFLELADFQTLFTKYDSSLRLCLLTDLNKNLHGTFYICKYYVVKFSYLSVHRKMSYGSECKAFGFFFNTLYINCIGRLE